MASKNDKTKNNKKVVDNFNDTQLLSNRKPVYAYCGRVKERS